MSLEKAREYLKQFNLDHDIMVFDESSATVDLAARALHCEPCRIAKTLSFEGEYGPILIVAAGDTKIDNHKFKEHFHKKAKMLKPEVVEDLVGHAIGGVCPFGTNEGVEVWLDSSLKRFDYVYPACGSSNSAIRLSVEDLFKISKAKDYIDIAKETQCA